MKEFKLAGFNCDTTADWRILHSLWAVILHCDELWHFFWEGEYTVVRCSNSFVPEAENFLNERKISFTIREWEENIPITNKYYLQFRTMFHSFSELAMRMEEKDFLAVLERVCHCFVNNCFTKRGKVLEACTALGLPSSLWEPLALQSVVNGRAFTVGHLIGQGVGWKAAKKDRQSSST